MIPQKKPRVIISKYDGNCRECRRSYSEGDNIVWQPGERGALCESCGQEILEDEQ